MSELILKYIDNEILLIDGQANSVSIAKGFNKPNTHLMAAKVLMKMVSELSDVQFPKTGICSHHRDGEDPGCRVCYPKYTFTITIGGDDGRKTTV